MSPSAAGPARTTYDAVVVGSGPGGASVARALARDGRSVLVVERGGDAEPSPRVGRQLADLFVPGRSLHVADRGSVLVLAAHTLGGSSMYWFGSVEPPPASVFAPVGVDLAADTAALMAELAPAALPRDLFGPRAGLLHDAARSLGLDWRPLPKLADAGVLRELGPAGWRQARWTARRFVADAVTAGAEVLLRAVAVRVLHAGGVARGVELRVGGRPVTVAAGLVVLAAGGLGTPVVLGRSGWPAARDFFYDPVMTVSGTVDGLDAGMEPPMLGALDRVDSDGYLLTDLTRPRWLHSVLTAAAGRPDRIPAYRRTVSVMIKTRDGLSGRLTDRGRVAKPLTPSDRAIFARALPEAEAIVRAAGGRGLFRAGHVAVHPGGTAKIGDVVDSDLQTRVQGLYVCDASVIPAAWGLPPTFTVLALARRLGRHLTDGAAAPGMAAEKDVPDPV